LANFFSKNVGGSDRLLALATLGDTTKIEVILSPVKLPKVAKARSHMSLLLALFSPMETQLREIIYLLHFVYLFGLVHRYLCLWSGDMPVLLTSLYVTQFSPN
jgi:hypothetical protein